MEVLGVTLSIVLGLLFITVAGMKTPPNALAAGLQRVASLSGAAAGLGAWGIVWAEATTGVALLLPATRDAGVLNRPGFTASVVDS